ncbi:hypothetical protein N7532_010496 [Penicillium argentinense]|uniref:DUF3431 domain containing protein n=1 Tax=Penicillium argentinense TaxID=1131581 RepID=A0A9W9JY33_9EURO|nr:uncharacterized protein N7532_010496 [Penicillium argentinense]KAJ5085725.1 hypothetical protein N7532_010496 [Penicillium argentinense]
MILSRRAVLFLGFGIFTFLFFTARALRQPHVWNKVPQAVGLGEYVSSSPHGFSISASTNWSVAYNVSTGYGPSKGIPFAPQPHFISGIPKPHGAKYTKRLVVPRTMEEDVTWIAQELPDWDTAIYVANDPSAPLHPPKNKGHEVMIYLSYAIDFYDDLPDVSVFVHAHKNAWHNDFLHNGDTPEMVRRLNLNRVIREGYMNLRCSEGPGCPDWMHPGAIEPDEQKQEEVMLARAWGELFPDEPVPSVLAQPCCAQFAVSKERIRTIPRSRFIFYRDWLLQTDLSDYIAGRIWEYLWQYVFTGQTVLCPQESVCLCDGYGYCFGGPDGFEAFKAAQAERDEWQQYTESWDWMADNIEDAKAEGDGELDETMDLDVPEPGGKTETANEYAAKAAQVNAMLENAIARGNDPRLRAEEVGRPWKPGDSF